jgi:hypothetical protein
MKRGEAYGFIDCKASKEQITAELPTIRRLARTPSDLEISLDSVKTPQDPDLRPIANQAKSAGMRYALRVVHPNADNSSAKDELTSVLNTAYQSPLYSKKEQFRGEVAYKTKAGYAFAA